MLAVNLLETHNLWAQVGGVVWCEVSGNHTHTHVTHGCDTVGFAGPMPIPIHYIECLWHSTRANLTTLQCFHACYKCCWFQIVVGPIGMSSLQD